MSVSNYPKVVGEFDTMRAILSGKSISRLGDGEIAHADKSIGGGRQKADRKLSVEMVRVLTVPHKDCITGIPTMDPKGPKYQNWIRHEGRFRQVLSPEMTYYSAFISRADSAPWCDTLEFAEMWEKVWKGKFAVVLGPGPGMTKVSKVPTLVRPAAARMEWIHCVLPDAYSHIDEYEEKIHKLKPDVAILSAGPCATVLARRLGEEGIHAIDFGSGATYIYKLLHKGGSQLYSDEYQKQLRALHASPRGFGGGGYSHAATVKAFAAEMKCESILDYGCGQGTLKQALDTLEWMGKIREYDPGVPGKEGGAKRSDLVVCTDVLEHIEPEHLDDVLDHILALADKAVYFCVAHQPANKELPDGRNAHLIVKPPDWWSEKVRGYFHIMSHTIRYTKEAEVAESVFWMRVV